MPPPFISAVFVLNVELLIVGDDDRQAMPPPRFDVLLLNEQLFVIKAEEELSQKIPPPMLSAELLSNWQLEMAGEELFI